MRRARLLARARTLSIVGCNTRRVGRRAGWASAKRSQLQKVARGRMAAGGARARRVTCHASIVPGSSR
ncbi:hypothetical protein D8O27_29175 [Burkholderia mallei]|uniref:Uncharacterized protein n=2 Tax=Burkholderia mallei TaxID=13373 RepID=A0AAX1XAI8_BURML|nr:hypothetical protein BMAA0118 [Burkholderia mallei ATCC 23344]RKN93161.1 hypothetical protein D8O31_25500 [Burkholderia mallei]RKN94689.1 hypothetical protein D8O03_24845 [Burkholderia mallei]RKN97914.1 hypothetical protein D8O05_24135 [Burkholderia mallei]RKO15100.1 hypothetical protein D8O30_23595 [Burkholderia mallei]